MQWWIVHNKINNIHLESIREFSFHRLCSTREWAIILLTNIFDQYPIQLVKMFDSTNKKHCLVGIVSKSGITRLKKKKKKNLQK